jgi:hypothetical protein
MENIYYVYQYLREDMTPYYIGKGKNYRAYQSHKRSNGVELRPDDRNRIKIIKQNLTEEQAFNLEKQLISECGLKLEGGLLVNLLYGGQGYSPSEEMRKLQSERMIGINKGRKLGPPSAEATQNRVASLKEWYKTVDKSAKAWRTWHTRYTNDYLKFENAISLLNNHTIMEIVKETGFDYTTIRRLKDKSHPIYDHFPLLANTIA